MLEHKAVRAPREDILGEMVYARNWYRYHRLAGPEDLALADILRNLTEVPGQRCATIAATVIQWLGSDVGGSILAGLRHLDAGPSAYHRQRFYLAAWATTNFRQAGVNRGARMLEMLMAQVDGGTADEDESFARAAGLGLTAFDHEVADHVFSWLGSDPGVGFVNQCEEELTRLSIETGRPPRTAVMYQDEKIISAERGHISGGGNGSQAAE